MAWYSETTTVKKNSKKELWVKCKKCQSHIYNTEWQENHNVCPNCNYHDSITSYERINLIFDENTFVELFDNISPADSLNFVDLKGSYKDKYEANIKKTGISESVVTGHGKINGIPAVIAVMDFRFLGGSLGSGTGEKILQAANYAYDNNLPYIVFSASGGARMQEGALSLMQMAKTCAGVARLNKKNIPYISVLTNPTTGGVSASYAMVGDLNIAEPGALIAFAGRRVIEQTIGEKLPDDFQTAEYLLEHGFIDSIVNRKDMKAYLSNILSFYSNKSN
ncbi:MAG TPA: acetyl-CoA carboxylase carboxyl transferase subunit beta [Bacteroidales bacterium]|jgi:acetyl-CoA carboxylase carboxyl transferase subunit beta|nr:acetyl-CoA carboxylase carboxyl transferase subunit beta [Bacteroidales bacterium]